MHIPSVEASPYFEKEEILDIIFNGKEVGSKQSASFQEISSVHSNDRSLKIKE